MTGTRQESMAPLGRASAFVSRYGVPILGTAGAVIAFTVAFAIVHTALTHTYQLYDDEGYMLLSLSHYMAGGRLYKDVFTQYGPFYFQFQSALFRLLHFHVNHDSGRFVTMILWLLSAVFGGLFTYRISRNALFASAAGLALVIRETTLAAEPGHPQQVILMLMMLACYVSVDAGAVSLFLLGAVAAALCLTKINVGAFYCVALTFSLVCSLPRGRTRTLASGVMLSYAAGFPVLLMLRNLRSGAKFFAATAVLCTFSTFLVGILASPGQAAKASVRKYVVFGFMTTAALVVTMVLVQGVSLPALVIGTLWAPLRQPGVFTVPFHIPGRQLLFTLVSTISVFALYRYREQWQAWVLWIEGLRCVAGFAVILCLAGVGSHTLPFMALLPLGLLPGRRGVWSSPDYFHRWFITALAATQYLQIYPVAGSQVSIAAAPSLLWGIMCVSDGVQGLFCANPKREPSPWRAVVTLSAIASMLFVLFGTESLRFIASRRHGEPRSRLLGATSLHLPANEENLFENLAGRVHANCDILFEMPGMGSLNFWSGVPTPNGFNLTAWMRGIPLDEQGQTLHALESDPNACVIYNPQLVTFWGETRKDLDSSPLARYILYNMPVVWTSQGYQIRINPHRATPWVEAEGATHVPCGPRPQIGFCQIPMMVLPAA